MGRDFDTRMFGGKRFKLRSASKTKTNAKKIAESWRKKGFNARVTKAKIPRRGSIFIVWARKKGT